MPTPEDFDQNYYDEPVPDQDPNDDHAEMAVATNQPHFAIEWGTRAEGAVPGRAAEMEVRIELRERCIQMSMKWNEGFDGADIAPDEELITTADVIYNWITR